MRMILFAALSAVLLFFSCDRGGDPLITDGQCITMLDCMDESYDCIDGQCVPATVDTDTVKPEAENTPDKDAALDADDTAVIDVDSTVDDTGDADDIASDDLVPEDDDPVDLEQESEDETITPDDHEAPLPEEDELLSDADTTPDSVTDADTDEPAGIPCANHSQCDQYTEVCYKNECRSPYRLAYIVKVAEVCLGDKDPNGESWETIPLFDKPDPYAIFNLNGTEVFTTEKGDETFCKTYSTNAQIAFEETDAVSVVVMEYDSGSISGDRYAGTLNLPNITIKMFRDGEYAESHPGEPLEYIKLSFSPAP